MKYVSTEAYKKFTTNLVCIIEHYHFFLQESFKLEDKVKDALKYIKQDTTVQSTSLSFYSIFNNELHTIENKSITRKERLDNIFYYRNKQIQYFFLEAVELYKKYLYDLYDEVLKNNQAFEIGKEHKHIQILSVIIKKVKNYNKYKNKRINYMLKIPLFIQLRHIIAHNSGYINDSNNFAKKALIPYGIDCGDKKINKILSYIRIDKNNFVIMFEREEKETILDMKVYCNKREYGKEYIEEILSFVDMIDRLIFDHLNHQSR